MNTLSAALVYLSERCDGAHDEDGIGFNGTDTDFGKDMASKAEETWTYRQAAAVHKMLRKYRKQLAGGGIDYDAIPVPADQPEAEKAAERSLTWDGEYFRLKFPYDATLVAGVKALLGRRWEPLEKAWRVNPTAENCAFLVSMIEATAFTVPADAEAELRKLAGNAELERAVKANQAAVAKQQREWAAVASRATDADLMVEGLRGELMPFQRAGVAYAIEKKRVLFGDQMGLGKTVQGIATWLALDAFPHLVFCPASLKRNWEREAKKWLPIGKKIAVIEGTNPGPGWQRADVVIVNYDLLRVEPREKGSRKPVVLKGLAAELQAHPWKGVTADEFHYCKNHKAQRTQAVEAIAKPVEIVLGLTGTPVLNRPEELTTPLKILRRLDDLGGFWKFITSCGLYKGAFGLEPIREKAEERARRLAKVHAQLREVCMVRRLKADVLTELPAKRRATLPLTIDNRPTYDSAERDFIAWLVNEGGLEAAEKAKRAEALAKLTHLRHLAAQGKLAAATEWIADFLESGEKLVVFAHHIDIQAALAAKFPGCAVLRGEDDSLERDANVQRFQNDEDCRLIVCSLKAGGVGLTLTAASNVAFVEMGWTPGEHDQAEDRCHRIGQTDSVTAWYLLAEDTIDEKLAALIDHKRATVDAVTDGAISPLSESILSGLLKAVAA